VGAVDESATGSVSFYRGKSLRTSPDYYAPMHLRLPSIDKGVTAFLWALFFGLYFWLGGIAVGVGKGTAFLIALVAAFVIFLYVRIYGEDRVRRSAV
jgi:hypothetical protein